jgi:hypothetical protein
MKNFCDPRAETPEMHNLKWDLLEKQRIFDFDDNDHEFQKYSNMIYQAKHMSITLIYQMICNLAKIYDCSFEPLKERPVCDEPTGIFLAIKDHKNNVILFFKKIEDGPLWIDHESTQIQKFVEDYGCTSFKYVYLLYDQAYLQVIGHDDNEDDPGRGYNLYSMKWLFNTYFSQEEFDAFCSAIKKYKDNVRTYIGRSVVKQLNPNALINFRKIVESSLDSFDYEDISGNEFIKENKHFTMPADDYQKIRNQFFGNQRYLVLLGNQDYAESFITAEWLMGSMKKAHAIDLTTIGMGYMKSFEQLLYAIVCMHADEGKKIRRKHVRKGLNDEVDLTSASIDHDEIDSTIGSLATFVKNNFYIFNDELSNEAMQYIREKIYDYANIRNTYFHKKNIKDIRVIEKIRNETVKMMFLLLGSIRLTDKYEKDLGVLDIPEIDDFQRLCEYVNYHAGEPFIIKDKNNKIISYLTAQHDIFSKIINGSYIQYSGLHFVTFTEEHAPVNFTKDNVPGNIYSCELVIAESKEIKLDLKQGIQIYKDGRFVGPSLAEEIKDY